MTGPTLTSPFKNAQQLNKGGRTLTYIPAAEVIDRLNACLGIGGWDYGVDVVHTDPDFVVVKGRLMLSESGAFYEQFGGQKINKTKAGEPIDLGDDFKGAASDALKKCAACIGVGLYLALGHSPTSASLVSAETPGSADAMNDGAEKVSPPTPSPAVANSPKENSKREEGDQTSDSPQVGTQEEVAGDGKKSGSPAADSEPLWQECVRRFNALPPDKTAAALGERKRLGIRSWERASEDELKQFRGWLTQHEAQGVLA